MNYDPVIVGLAVMKNVWTVDQALALTEQRSDPEFRLKIYTCLLKKTGVNDPRWRSILQRALDMSRELENKKVTSTLSELAEGLTGEMALETLKMILEIQDPEIQSALLNSKVWIVAEDLFDVPLEYVLIERLENDHIQPALDVILESEEAHLMILILPRLSSQQIQAVLEWALTIDDEQERYFILSHITDQPNHLDEKQVSVLFNEALKMYDEDRQASMLYNLSGQLIGKQVQTALEASMGFSDNNNRAGVLGGLSERLDEEQLQIAISAALLIKEESNIYTLCYLSDRLQGKQKETVLQTIQEAAQEIPDNESRAYALYEVAKRVQGDQKHLLLISVMQAAKGTDDDIAISLLLSRLSEDFEAGVFVLTDDLLTSGIELTMGLTEPSTKAILLTEWSKPLDSEDLKQILKAAFDTALGIQDFLSRWETLENITKRLLDDQIQIALEIIIQWENEFNLFAAIQPLVPRFNEKQLTKTLEFAQTLKHKILRIRLLITLSEQAESEFISQFVDMAINAFQLMRDDKSKSAAIEYLAPTLNDRQLQSVYAVVITIVNEKERAAALIELIPELGDVQKRKALRTVIDTAKNIPDNDKKLRLLEKIIHYIEDKDLQEVLEIVVDSLGFFYTMTEDLIKSILSSLNEADFRFVFNLLFNIDDVEYRVRALSSLSNNVPEDQIDLVSKYVLEKMTGLQFAPLFHKSLLAKIENKKFIAEFKESCFVVDERINLVLSFPNLESRAEALISIAEEVDANKRFDIAEEALKAIEQLSEVERSDLLVSLSPYLGEEQIQTAYQLALDIQDITYQTKALGSIANFDGEKQKSQIHQAAFNILNYPEKAAEQILALGELIPHLDHKLKANILQSALDISLHLENEAGKMYALENLMPLLDLEQRNFAVQTFYNSIMVLEDGHVFAGFIMRHSSLLEYLGARQVEKILGKIFQVEDEFYLCIALESIIFMLNNKQLQSACEVVKGLEDINEKADLLIQIALQIKGKQSKLVRQAALSSVLDVIKKKDNVPHYADFIDTLNDEELIRTLGTVMEIDDCSSKVYSLGPLISKLSGEAKSQAISSALGAMLTINNSSFLIDCLKEIIPSGLNTGGLEQLSRATIANALWKMKYFNRPTLLKFLAEESWVSPEMLKTSKETYGEITQSIIEICDNWRWN